jgi:hypothetical protein
VSIGMVSWFEQTVTAGILLANRSTSFSQDNGFNGFTFSFHSMMSPFRPLIRPDQMIAVQPVLCVIMTII